MGPNCKREELSRTLNARRKKGLCSMLRRRASSGPCCCTTTEREFGVVREFSREVVKCAPIVSDKSFCLR